MNNFWRGKKVFITGHTGFKGGWLSAWLIKKGAIVYGYSLPPSTFPNLYTLLDIEGRIETSTIGDIRNIELLQQSISKANPEIIFHLAAQPLVRHSYIEPIETFSVNVMGTVNLFEVAKRVSDLRAIVNVTTDKCYLNLEAMKSFSEDDPLGGCDPYSSSKACSEIITQTYQASFFKAPSEIKLASARAGNVIGGGDWSEDRLVPDFFRHLVHGESLLIRSPNSIRPWQHVLEPLNGYLLLAEKLYLNRFGYSEAWNFGPASSSEISVEDLLKEFCRLYPGVNYIVDDSVHCHEAKILKLDSKKAIEKLGWRTRWDFSKTVENTSDWYKANQNGNEMFSYTLKQIEHYENS